MQTYVSPSKSEWIGLCRRYFPNPQELETIVNAIINEVKANGDQALFKLTKKYDKVDLLEFKVPTDSIEKLTSSIPASLKESIAIAKYNIEKFHNCSIPDERKIETTKGVFCWSKRVPIEKVGLYIPGGTAPLFSSILMLGIPAMIAGCKEIILCSPPNKEGLLSPVVLYTARLLGIENIYALGGAQAIAAMAYGTESVPSVDKIFGPGNSFVTKAKELVSKSTVAIDMPAGPSEVLIIADESADPEFLAADLLAQAEHGPDSQVMIVSNSMDILQKTQLAIATQIKNLPRKNIAEQALSHSRSIYFKNINRCFEFSNEYAPEHLILSLHNALSHIDKITNAGSVFLGKYSCESAGDYASGTNHTLPTNANAKAYSGVSVESFQKKITFQRITKEGLQKLGPHIEILADAEGLQAHKNAVSIRLKKIKNV